MRRLLLAMFALCMLSGVAAAQMKIIIDPGHGGEDPGGVGTGMQEKIVVLDVSKRFKALLDADTADPAGGGKWTALLTRTNDTFVSLAGRSQYSNNQDADRFMSIHSNAFGNTTANGTETFSLTEGGTSSQLRNLVQAEMIAAWGLTNRGNKTANFAVLRDTAAPAVLHELAFITNATDAAKLASPAERQKAAIAHLRAIQRHYGIAPYVPGGTTPTDQDGEVAARVVDDLGPVAGAMVKLDTGAVGLTDAEGRVTITKAMAGARTLTVTADGYVEQTVELTVAAQMTAETEIVLVKTGGEPEPEPADGEGGGCSTSANAGLLLGLLALTVRRRR
jgi:N-acetylmuramoyl-L-alanine amidase